MYQQIAAAVFGVVDTACDDGLSDRGDLPHSLRLHEKMNQYLVENKVRVCGLGANDEDMEKFFVEKLSRGKAV